MKALFASVVLAAASISVAEVSPDEETNLAVALRTAFDLARLDVAEVIRTAQFDKWMWIEVTPDLGRSGRYATAVVDPVTGRRTLRDNGLFAAGTLAAVPIGAADDKRTKIDYRWQVGEDVGAIDDFKRPSFRQMFAGSGSYVVRVTRPLGGAQLPFDRVFFVPRHMQSDLWKAWRVMSDAPALFDADTAVESREQLRPLLTDENAFLAMAAGRLLGQTDDRFAVDIMEAIEQSRGYRQAALIVLMWENVAGNELVACGRRLVELCRNAEGASDLLGIALGLATYTRAGLARESLDVLRLVEKEMTASMQRVAARGGNDANLMLELAESAAQSTRASLGKAP